MVEGGRRYLLMSLPQDLKQLADTLHAITRRMELLLELLYFLRWWESRPSIHVFYSGRIVPTLA